MSQLETFTNQDGVELIINITTGEAFASISGYSRISGKAKSTICERIDKLVRSGGIETAEVDTGYGVKVVRLIPAKLVYHWLINDNPKLAVQMGEVGATAFLHQIAGFKIKSTAITPQPKSTAEMFAMAGNVMLEHEEKIKILESIAFKHQAHLLDQGSKIDVIKSDLLEFKTIQAQNIAALNYIEPPTTEAKSRPRTADLNEFVRKHAIDKNILFKDCYNKIYREFRDRYHIDLKMRGKNHDPKLSGIKMADKLNMLEELFAVAVEILT